MISTGTIRNRQASRKFRPAEIISEDYIKWISSKSQLSFSRLLYTEYTHTRQHTHLKFQPRPSIYRILTFEYPGTENCHCCYIYKRTWEKARKERRWENTEAGKNDQESLKKLRSKGRACAHFLAIQKASNLQLMHENFHLSALDINHFPSHPCLSHVPQESAGEEQLGMCRGWKLCQLVKQAG